MANAKPLLPAAVVQLPGSLPPAGPLAAAAGLGLVSAMLQFTFYRMLRQYGSSRTNLVVYVAPPFALLFGVIFFDEPVRAGALAGLALILVGVTIASGLVGRRRVRAAT